jgi:hypothetical protein
LIQIVFKFSQKSVQIRTNPYNKNFHEKIKTPHRVGFQLQRLFHSKPFVSAVYWSFVPTSLSVPTVPKKCFINRPYFFNDMLKRQYDNDLEFSTHAVHVGNDVDDETDAIR